MSRPSRDPRQFLTAPPQLRGRSIAAKNEAAHFWPHRLMVRTALFQGVNPGSIPGGAAKIKKFAIDTSYEFAKVYLWTLLLVSLLMRQR